ncbi:hypothetical protein [Desulfosarcina variabilis]|uniref:hypothetical protein n=1 Tax=Desulfosarcina variabilis TaxID=2300 RepID=UPI003AFB454B
MNVTDIIAVQDNWRTLVQARFFEIFRYVFLAINADARTSVFRKLPSSRDEFDGTLQDP